jgi:signal peptidase II
MIAGERLAPYLYGPRSSLGLAAAVLAAAVDQASKLWLLDVFDLGARRVVEIAPVLDLTLVWNSGISYGLFQHGSPAWQHLLLTVKAVAIVLLWVWLAQSRSWVSAVSLGLIIGGAVGNAIDSLAYGAVADFVHFHVGNFSWYVFNIADAAIVAGVVGLLYEAVLGRPALRAGSAWPGHDGAPPAPLS